MSVRRSVATAFALVLLVGLSAGAVQAAEPGWKYVEGGYLGVDVDSLEGSGDSWFVGGAFGGKFWHAIGQYANGDISDDLDRREFRLGAGWHGLLGEKADLLAEAYYVDSQVKGKSSSDFGKISDDGYRLVFGVRWRVIKFLELDGFVNYTDFSKGGSDSSYELRAIVNIWRVGIGAGYEKFDDFDQYNVFARFNFN